MPERKLNKDSGKQAVRTWISTAVETCMNEPIPPGTDVTEETKNKWCAAKAYSMAREDTGQDIGKEI